MFFAIKAFFLFLAVLFTFVNFYRAYCHQDVSAPNSVLWAVGVVGFVVLQWMI